MSIISDIKTLSYENRTKIAKDLEIKLADNKYSFGDAKYIYPYELNGDILNLPFAYATRNLKMKRPARTNFPGMPIKFQGILREEQQEILKEAISILNNTGSVVISAYPGFGKCLKFNTPVLMHDGTVKMVQNIKAGDILMGDDSTPRNVLGICIGNEQMYDITPAHGNSFGCNENHILSLKVIANKSIHKKDRIIFPFYVKYFDHSQLKFINKYFSTEKEALCFRDTVISKDVIDITVKNFLSLPQEVKSCLKYYRNSVDFPNLSANIDPYVLGLWLGESHETTNFRITTQHKEIISYVIKYCNNNNFNVSYDISDEIDPTESSFHDFEDIVLDSKFIELLKRYNLFGNKHIPHNFKCNDRNIRLSLLSGIIDSCGVYENNVCRITKEYKKLANDIVYLALSLGFDAYVRENRVKYENHPKEIFKICYDIIIHDIHSTKVPSFIYNDELKIPKKFTVYDFNITPIEENTYYGFTIDGNGRFLLGDFTVTHNTCCSINAACTIGFKTLVIANKLVLLKQWDESIKKFCPNSRIQILNPKSVLEDCDFYIINAQNVQKFNKKLFENIGTLIVDEAHMIMAETLHKSLQNIHPRYVIGLTATPYRPDGLDILLELFFGKDKIVRKLWRKHTVYKVSTGLKPPTTGSNWGEILDFQANDSTRNKLIIKILKHFSTRNFLVPVKRVSQGESLVEQLLEDGESVTSLLGSNQKFDKTSRILVGTIQKIGVGFDHPKLDALLLATDVEEYFIQYLGRVFRTEDGEPIVVDLLDNHGILIKHFSTRRKIYQESGGTIVNFNISV